MSGGRQSDLDLPGPGFDPLRLPWFMPLLALLLVASVRIFLPETALKPELVWFDQALQFREAVGLAKPLDPVIRFVELKMDDEIARRFADNGEYATAADILTTIAQLGAKVIALDVIYCFGRQQDQELLADTIRSIEAEGRTKVVLSVSLEHEAKPPHKLRSLPLADGEPFMAGVVNAPAGDHWRGYNLVHRFGDETLPSLALAAYAATLPKPLQPKVTAPGVMTWKTLDENTGDITAAYATDEHLYLNLRHSYYDDEIEKQVGLNRVGGARRVFSIPQIEALAARSGDGPPPLAEAIVFLGYSSEVDGKPTAHSDLEPGMLLHGTALSDLMEGTEIRSTSLWLNLLVLILVMGAAALCFHHIEKQRWLALTAGGGLAFCLLAGWASLWFTHHLIDSVAPASLWAGAIVLEMGRRWTREQQARSHRDAMLGFYFSPAVLKQVIQDLDMIRPRGNMVAALLSDLRGFTMLCETQPVERVFELLNRLFGIETDAALKDNGSLARFAGDQFLAYWGAPEPCADPADRALRAALEIQRTLAEKRRAPVDELDTWLNIGIGLHYGQGLVGHVGSRSYRDYNLVGDIVNTTARVESQTKNYSAPILVTGEFLAALGEKPPVLLVDRVKVKGKAKASELWAVLLEGDSMTLDACRIFEEAFALYHEGNFEAAAAAFGALTANPFPTVATSSDLLAARSRELQIAQPAGWTGVFELTSK